MKLVPRPIDQQKHSTMLYIFDELSLYPMLIPAPTYIFRDVS